MILIIRFKALLLVYEFTNKNEFVEKLAGKVGKQDNTSQLSIFETY